MNAWAALHVSSRAFNRKSVEQAMASTMAKLRTYKQIPATGLAIFSGLVAVPGSDKMKRVCVDLVPLKPIKYAMYHCDNRFHTESLQEQLKELLASSGNGQATQRQIGFVIVSGEGCLYGKLDGTNKEVLFKFKVDLPKKHRKGGQSQKRFERLTQIARGDYIKEAAEHLNKVFINSHTQQAIVSTLIYAGPANLKQVLSECDQVDYRLRKLPNTLVDIGYGFETGFQQAIELAAATIQDLRYVKESSIINNFMAQIVKDGNKTVYGVAQTMNAVDMGLAEKLIVFEDLDTLRVTYKKVGEDEETVAYVSPAQFNKMIVDSKGANIEYESQLLLEWLTEHYKEKNLTLEIITDATPEAKQFCKGFGGLGGLLRFEMDQGILEAADSADASDDLSEYL